jgi:very-short-patch-repair endonuclease
MGTQLTARPRDRRALAKRERELAQLAKKQYGVLSRQQLLSAGLSQRTIRRRLEAGRLRLLHRGVYAHGAGDINIRGTWLAAVLVIGEGAVLSHHSAAALWGLRSNRPGPIEVSAGRARSRHGIRVHEGGIHRDERTVVNGIPVTTVARTLFDLAEVTGERTVESAFEEADRLGLLQMRALEAVCARGHGRRALRVIRPLIDAALKPETTRSPLEDRFLEFCREHDLPQPQTNVLVLGYEVDAHWPEQRLVVEADSWSFHHHRAAFERDRARDAAMQAEGYRALRVTSRRLEDEPKTLAAELRRLLADVPPLRGPYGYSSGGTSQRGQGTVEWVALVCLVALTVAGLVAAGVRVPGTALARAVASRLLCAASLADGCGDEPALIAAYGTEVGKLVREHMPEIFLEPGSKALPVDFRRCRSPACGDGTERGLVHRSDSGLAVTAFVHVVDCRPGSAGATEAEGADCSGPRAGNLYIQYWLYYADSATLRRLIGGLGYHRDDWESVQIRIGADGDVAERASSHEGYNHERGPANWGSDAGITPLRDAAEAIGARPHDGWGAETHALLVSGGSHAGNVDGIPGADRAVPGRRVHLVALEPIAADSAARFAITPPWRKQVWDDPEAEGTE